MSETPPTKTLKSERYVIDGTLGEGAQAVTYSAFDRLSGTYVAIKRFEVRGAKRWKDVELAEREAAVLGSLSHPKLPKYIEHFEEDGALYLVMEKIEGKTLRDIMRGGEGLDEDDIERLLADLGDICNYLHGRAPPVVHRDIKPGNVIRRPDGSFALVDFGAVRDRLRPEGGSTVVGTFGYMAPEQFQGRASAVSDWYAVGATCLAAWTGTEPENLPHRGLGIDVRAALPHTRRSDLARVIADLVAPDPEARCIPRGSQAPSRSEPQRGAPSAKSTKSTKSERNVRKNDDARRDYREQRRNERRERRVQKRLAKADYAANPIPMWLRVICWVAWGVSWPVIAETRVLVVPWIILPFILGAFARSMFKREPPAPAATAKAEDAANEAARVRVDAPAEQPRRVIDAEYIDDDAHLADPSSREPRTQKR